VTGVRFENVTMGFGRRELLSACSAQFGPGMHAITGPSGCGKTTTLNLIAGYLTPIDGRVSVEGRVGYLLQDDALFGGLSAADNLAVQAEVGVPGLRTLCATEMLRAVGLADQAGQSVAKLSGGERKRLSLAMTVSQAPDILLLDEPTASLDDANKDMLAGLLASLCDGMCVIVATHDLDFVSELPNVCARRLVKGGLVDA